MYASVVSKLLKKPYLAAGRSNCCLVVLANLAFDKVSYYFFTFLEAGQDRDGNHRRRRILRDRDQAVLSAGAAIDSVRTIRLARPELRFFVDASGNDGFKKIYWLGFAVNLEFEVFSFQTIYKFDRPCQRPLRRSEPVQ